MSNHLNTAQSEPAAQLWRCGSLVPWKDLNQWHKLSLTAQYLDTSNKTKGIAVAAGFVCAMATQKALGENLEVMPIIAMCIGYSVILNVLLDKLLNQVRVKAEHGLFYGSKKWLHALKERHVEPHRLTQQLQQYQPQALVGEDALNRSGFISTELMVSGMFDWKADQMSHSFIAKPLSSFSVLFLKSANLLLGRVKIDQQVQQELTHHQQVYDQKGPLITEKIMPSFMAELERAQLDEHTKAVVNQRQEKDASEEPSIETVKPVSRRL